MAPADVVNTVVTTFKDYFTYMLPIIALMGGIVFITSFLMYVTVGAAKRIFKG